MALDLSSLLACQREREEKRKDYYGEELREGACSSRRKLLLDSAV
jgi:hypothetical protein